MRTPFVIDNRNHRLADVLNQVLSGHKDRSLDIATAYFNVGGFDLIKDGLNDLGSFRLLLGAEPTAGVDIGLKPSPTAIKGLLRKDLEDLPFDEKTYLLIEDLIGYLAKMSVAVRVHEEGFLHAKCYLFYADQPNSDMLFDRFHPLLGIVGSSNFTRPGLTTNLELNLVHKVLFESDELTDHGAADAVAWLTMPSLLHLLPSPEEEDVRSLEIRQSLDERITSEERLVLKSEVGARAIMDLERWFEERWIDSRDFKQELIEILDASKFGRVEYTPYQVYLKALYAYLKDDLDAETSQDKRSAVELAEFQEDAVKKARKILARYDGVMIADSVGLGKTWIGKKLLEDFAYHMRQKALIVCPASLREMWQRELTEATISGRIISQEELGREEFDVREYGDADVILIDESHNFRNQNAQRYAQLEMLLGLNNKKGRDGGRKKVILLTATPINNDLLDLYNQIRLITMGDRSYFTSCGIGDVHRYFLKARRESRDGNGGVALFNLLEEVVIRRTRPFIRRAYPEATIQGKTVRFPGRRLRTVNYNLESTYEDIYEQIVSGINSLKLAPYNLEAYKKTGVDVDKFEEGREQALVGIFKSRYLKRFESSIEAFRISVGRALAFMKTFESYILDNKLMKSSDFHKALRYLDRENEEDDATPKTLADDLDASEEAKAIIESLETIDTSKYSLRKIHQALQFDVEVFTEIWHQVKSIKPGSDAKLNQLKALLSNELKDQKVLIFTYYKDTARYLYRNLGDPENPGAVEFLDSLGGINIRRMDGGTGVKDRLKTVQRFSPKANGKPELSGTDREINILISTDVLSEGQNLQDCGYMLNYDLHWNPTRMVQRAGRIDRIGTDFDTLWIYNMFPDAGLERLLGLVESLNRKIADIDQAGFLDASVLGETAHPQNFNTLRRIEGEDGTVLEEEEQFIELASSEYLSQLLRNFMDSGGKEMLDSLPDGIHSGLLRSGAKGVFFYFQADPRGGEKQHFWKYYDLKDDTITDNRFIIANLISCEEDTPRVVESDMFKSVFGLQERVIEDILQSTEKQIALEMAPRTIDPMQQTVATAIQQYMQHPEVDRKKAIESIRFLNQPMLAVQIKELRKAFREFQTGSDINKLLLVVDELKASYGSEAEVETQTSKTQTIQRSDLRLICFDLVWGG